MHPSVGEELSLEGQVAVVTGGGSGIGQGVALLFAQAGAKLVIGDLSHAGIAETIALVEDAGSTAIGTFVDVARREDVDRLAETALREWDRLDIWVNCAGVIMRQPLADASEEVVRRQLDVNLLGTLWGCTAAYCAMKPRGGGSIINISSMAGDLPVPDCGIYGISKGGVNLCTFNCALEFGPAGVRVNAIAPGFIDTPMTSARLEADAVRREEIYRARAAGTVLGMIGQPRDIAHAALYLATPASRYVTGQVMRVNGGAGMR